MTLSEGVARHLRSIANRIETTPYYGPERPNDAAFLRQLASTEPPEHFAGDELAEEKVRNELLRKRVAELEEDLEGTEVSAAPGQPSEEIERYGLGYFTGEESFARPNGEWVRFEDHQQRIGEAERERDDWRNQTAAERQESDRLRSIVIRAEKAEQRLGALREALSKFGEHRAGCMSEYRGRFEKDCDCGLLAALDAEDSPDTSKLSPPGDDERNEPNSCVQPDCKGETEADCGEKWECEACHDEGTVLDVIATTPNGDELGEVPCPDCGEKPGPNLDVQCGAPSPQGRSCTRTPGHDDVHAALKGPGTVELETWPVEKPVESGEGLEGAAQGAVLALDALFAHLSGLVEEGGLLPVVPSKPPFATSPPSTEEPK